MYYLQRQIVFLTLLCLCACGGKTGGGVWGVYLPGLPDKIKAELANDDAVYYLLKQTHEPILRKEDGQNYSSRLLDRWERNAASSRYSFCLKAGLRFSFKEPFSKEQFLSHMVSVADKYGDVRSVDLSGNCVDVGFNGAHYGFMDFLTKYENAPTLADGKDVEIGLGPYYVKSISGARIVLARKKTIKDGYNSIVMFEYGGPGETLGKDVVISDYNRIPEKEIPSSVKKRMVSFTNITLKSVGLVINIRDKELRRTVYNCVDPKALRAAFFPSASGFYNIRTMLPLGVPGAEGGVPIQECKIFRHSGEGRKLMLANWRKDNLKDLKNFSQAFFKKTGIHIAVRNYEAADLVRTLFKRPHPYDLFLISSIALMPEHDVFFKNFLKAPDLLTDYGSARLEKMYSTMLVAEDANRKKDIALNIAEGLANENFVLPLYQETRVFYYPSEIKNILIGKSFVEYPEVGDFYI